MALLVDVDFKGIKVKKAYVSVGVAAIASDKTYVAFVASYRPKADQDYFDQKSLQAPYTLDGDNPFMQAYAHLKTLPEFADATDA